MSDEEVLVDAPVEEEEVVAEEEVVYEEQDYDVVETGTEIKLFGKWSFDEISVRDVSLQVSVLWWMFW
jgi:small subunit ribosomal protein S5e